MAIQKLIRNSIFIAIFYALSIAYIISGAHNPFFRYMAGAIQVLVLCSGLVNAFLVLFAPVPMARKILPFVLSLLPMATVFFALAVFSRMQC